MKISAIDIGSNSVRLMLWADGKTLLKRLNTTRLGEGLNANGFMLPQAMDRTVQAISNFVACSKEYGAEKIYAYATAAVRSSSNRQVFLDKVKSRCGIDVEVLSGSDEAAIGLLGALGGGDGGIIDVGGASTEITVRHCGKVIYSRSVNIGTVRLNEMAGRDYAALEKVIDEKLKEYGAVDIQGEEMFAIGGSASRLASIKHNLMIYTPEITDGARITLEEVKGIARKMLTLSVDEIRATTICSTSADVIGGGCLLIYKIMKMLNISHITVSEKDNLEGFVLLKSGMA
jgi:exopolyphosphatase/guanosine-5'-triphosphate,3'-diphosphate pyrophosphatase